MGSKRVKVGRFFYVWCVDNTCSYIQILNYNCVVCFKSIKLLDVLVRLRSLCELRRDTEFSKEKYRKRGIFGKFVVAGGDFARSAQSAGCAQICSYSNCVSLVLIYKFWTGNCVAMVQTNKPHNTMFNKKYATGAYFSLKLVAGVGFEPTTFRLWAWRATGLLYPAIRCVYYILFMIIVK